MDGLGYHPVEVRAVPDGQHTAQQGECGQAGLQTVASPSPSPVVAGRSEETLSPRAAPRLRTTRRGSGRRVAMDRHSTRELRIAWPTAARRAVVRQATASQWKSDGSIDARRPARDAMADGGWPIAECRLLIADC